MLKSAISGLAPGPEHPQILPNPQYSDRHLWRSKCTFIICARQKYCGFHIRLAFLFWKPFKFLGQIVSPFQLLTTAHSTTDTSQLHVILDHLLASMQIFVNTSTLKVKSSEYQQCESPNQQHLIFSYNGSSPFPILVHPPPSPLSLWWYADLHQDVHAWGQIIRNAINNVSLLISDVLPSTKTHSLIQVHPHPHLPLCPPSPQWYADLHQDIYAWGWIIQHHQQRKSPPISLTFNWSILPIQVHPPHCPPSPWCYADLCQDICTWGWSIWHHRQHESPLISDVFSLLAKDSCTGSTGFTLHPLSAWTVAVCKSSSTAVSIDDNEQLM